MSIVGRTSSVDLVEPFDPGNEVITGRDRRVSMEVDTRSMSPRGGVCAYDPIDSRRLTS